MHEQNQKKTTRIVILGTGYAGIHAYFNLYKELGHRNDVEVVLISNQDHVLFVTMIYEIAGGNLSPTSIRQSTRILMHPHFARFIHGQVCCLDADAKTVTYIPHESSLPERAQEEQVLSFDYVIVALGSVTNFFNTPGAREHAIELKTLDDSIRIKNRIIEAFERAERIVNEDEIRALLSFIIIGGGPAGVTLVAKLADMINHEIRTAFPELHPYASLALVERGEKLLKQVDTWFHTESLKVLVDKRCVTVRLNTPVCEITKDGIVTPTDTFRGSLVVWTAGVQAQGLSIKAEKPVERDPLTCRIYATPFLTLKDYPYIYVIGDQACIVEKETGQPYPMRAQFAVRQGKVSAYNIARTLSGDTAMLEEFEWKDKGFIISLGHDKTLAEVFGIKFSGLPATTAYKAIYMLNTIGIRAKLRASIEWFLNVFLPRDISRL